MIEFAAPPDAPAAPAADAPPEAPPSALALVAPPELLVQPRTQQRAAENAVEPRTASTLRAYAIDWRRFERWARANGLPFLPTTSAVIGLHLTWLVEERRPPAKLATLQRAYTAIRVVHERGGHRLDTLGDVSTTLGNLARRLVELKVFATPKRALEAPQVIEACRKLPATLAGMRDRVVLLFGEAIGQRRAQICEVDVEDLEATSDGYRVSIRRSKVDQRGKGLVVYVTRAKGDGCPVAAVEMWLEASKIQAGALVRVMHKSGGATSRRLSGQAVATIVQRAAVSLGLDPKLYGAHSLRRGFVSSAARAGRDLDQIMRTTGHKSVPQVQQYIDDALDHARAAGRGLFDTVDAAPHDVDALAVQAATGDAFYTDAATQKPLVRQRRKR